MAETRHRVLVVERGSAEAEFTVEARLSASGSFVVDRAGTLKDALRRLRAERYDVVLLQLRLPDGEGLPALARVAASSDGAPVVVLADLSDELLALKAVKAGAADYLLSDQIFDTHLLRALWHAIEKRLREQLQQAHRLEAVGRLAGGIAHDFNNILTAIHGYADSLLEGLRPSEELWRDAEQIRVAADRAASLTRQLLAFSRKQVLQARILDPCSLVEGMRSMLERLIGEDVRLSFECEPDVGRVRADPGQIEQVILNLAVNARDAMPDGGTLRMELRNGRIGDVSQTEHFAPEDHVVLTLSDTGTGIPPDVLPHIFEPFFTTKAKGRGTGLGLSTVYGIIKQSGGHLEVESMPGSGTLFRIWLPRVEGEPAAELKSRVAPGRGAGEVVLLVEDEDALRTLAMRTLSRLGYTVMEARDGAEALRLAERADQPLHLLLTDVIMPNMSGRELAQRLCESRPGLKVLFMSGYTDEIITRHGELQEGQVFLEKPFYPAQLAARVRELLDTVPAPM